MRKALCAVPVLLSLICLTLPAWGETPAAPVATLLVAGARCPVSSLPGSASLQDVIPAPELKTVTCGNCSGVCTGLSPGAACTTENNEAGFCLGFFVGTTRVNCPGTQFAKCECTPFIE
ncbi:MAG TPA: hypothetical protein VF173_35195 [Thermoanaerobaculia bacterium]|nr:hypothetical protein [Thermoanaerobaculia bacterium]